MHPYLIEAMAADHLADLRRDAEAARRAAAVPRPHLRERWDAAATRLTARAYRPRAAVVCCPA
jgi:hypothetical protein